MATVAALDIGGTTLKGAVVDGGRVLAERRWPTPTEHGPAAVVEAVLAASSALMTSCATRPAALGLACLGLVDDEAGVAVRSTTVGWDDVPLVALARDRVGVPVVLAHDIRAAATAEMEHLDPSARGNLLFVAIGTGIGGAAVIGGRAVAGRHHRAGEIGHLRVSQGRLPCGCGRRGCLETVASGRAIAATYSERTGRAATAADVAAAAATGDGHAADVWQRATDALGEALATYSLLLDPATVVLGGGLSRAGAQLLEPVMAALASGLPFAGVPEVMLTRLGDRAAVLGAALAAAAALP